MAKVTIAGVGSSLVDFLFTNISFTAKPFTDFASKNDGDGGLFPGKLVFTDDFSKFTGSGYLEGLNRITGGRPPDAVNLGGPAIIALANAAQLCCFDDVSVSFYGARGDDHNGEILMDFLAGIDIDLRHYLTLEGSTPFTYVFSDPLYHDGKGERAFINNVGVGRDYQCGLVPEAFYDHDILLFGATAITPGIHRELGSMLKKGKDSGGFTVVATVYDFFSERKSAVERWPLGSDDTSYPNIDLLITDLEEALRLSGAADQEGAADAFAALGAGASIITNGAHRMHVQVNHGDLAPVESGGMPVCNAVDIDIQEHPDMVGDTTGCGDNFVGGVISSIAHQMSTGRRSAVDLRESVAWGAASGGFARFSVGGLYTESERGEKYRKVRHYRDLYRPDEPDTP